MSYGTSPAGPSLPPTHGSEMNPVSRCTQTSRPFEAVPTGCIASLKPRASSYGERTLLPKPTIPSWSVTVAESTKYFGEYHHRGPNISCRTSLPPIVQTRVMESKEQRQGKCLTRRSVHLPCPIVLRAFSDSSAVVRTAAPRRLDYNEDYCKSCKRLMAHTHW